MIWTYNFKNINNTINCLVLTLPISSDSIECVFSVTKFMKTSLKNKMEHDFFTNTLTIYIEMDIAKNIH